MSYEVTLVATVDLSVFLKRTTNPENHFRKSLQKITSQSSLSPSSRYGIQYLANKGSVKHSNLDEDSFINNKPLPHSSELHCPKR